MSRSIVRTRNVIIGVVSLVALAIAPTAQAYSGDWTLSGEFARTTTPSFFGGFNPNDINQFSATYDNRAKTFSVDLNYFEVPERDNVYVSFGTGQPDGSCATGALDITIASRDIVSTTTSQVWVPAQQFDNEDHHHGRGGYWTTVTTSGVDPDHYQRVATLERDGVDGRLQQVSQVNTSATEMGWTFGSPQLDGLTANCVEITVPGRRAPYVIAPAAVTPPVIQASAHTTGRSSARRIALNKITTHATRNGSRIKLKMRGVATRIQVRTHGSSKKMAFSNSLLIKNQPASVRYLYVRFSDGSNWSTWDRIAIT